MAHAAARFAATNPSNSFFYSSGRSSNEAGFLLQLMARLYGTNNISNCSFYCHQATGVGLGSTIGTGTATVELTDLDGCDLIFIIGANPAIVVIVVNKTGLIRASAVRTIASMRGMY